MAKSKRRKLQNESKPPKNSAPAAKQKPAPQSNASTTKPSKKSAVAPKPSTVPSQTSSAPPKPRDPPLPFTPYDRILLVGEGDFSYARALVEHHGCADVTATCLDTLEELLEKYPQAQENIAYLEVEDQKLVYGVDGTKLGKEGGGGKELKKVGEAGKRGFDRIVFNFPHVGGKSTDVNRQVRYNQEMLVGFFQAAKPLLFKPDKYDQSMSSGPGQILVTLFEQPPYSLWNIRDLARHVGLRPVTSSQFKFEMYPGYKHARTLGNLQGREDQGSGEGDPGEEKEEKEEKEEREQKRPGKWRGEERKARMYIFEAAPSEEEKDSGKGSGKARKRRAGSSSSDDDD